MLHGNQGEHTLLECLVPKIKTWSLIFTALFLKDKFDPCKCGALNGGFKNDESHQNV